MISRRIALGVAKILVMTLLSHQCVVMDPPIVLHGFGFSEFLKMNMLQICQSFAKMTMEHPVGVTSVGCF